MKKVLFLVLFIATFSLLTAGELLVSVEDENLIVKEWNYREMSTKKWPGCYSYDVLQGTGWFPSTWYTDYTPVLVDGDYVFETKSGFVRWYCGAEADEYNYVQVEYKLANGNVVMGHFRVFPNGTEDAIKVKCELTDNPDIYNKIKCQNAVVNWTNRGSVSVHLNWSR